MWRPLCVCRSRVAATRSLPKDMAPLRPTCAPPPLPTTHPPAPVFAGRAHSARQLHARVRGVATCRLQRMGLCAALSGWRRRRRLACAAAATARRRDGSTGCGRQLRRRRHRAAARAGVVGRRELRDQVRRDAAAVRNRRGLAGVSIRRSRTPPPARRRPAVSPARGVALVTPPPPPPPIGGPYSAHPLALLVARRVPVAASLMIAGATSFNCWKWFQRSQEDGDFGGLV